MAAKTLHIGKDKKVLGVCAGIAEYSDIDPTLVRILALIIIIGTGVIPGLLIYFISAAIMPNPHKK